MKAFSNHPHAFTLIELLVVIAIIALLIGILLPVIGQARDSAKMVRELSAVRNLMLAHTQYAHDQGGTFIPGYDTAASASDGSGNPLPFPATARYPWRIVPYFDYELLDTVLVNQRYEDLDGGTPDPYAVSVMPSFGINGDFVGGTWGGPYNNWLRGVGVAVTRQEQAQNPSDLIVFASARGGLSGSDPVYGYHLVQPAYGGSYNELDPPSAFGNVHPRYGGNAVIGFLDGHGGLLDQDELRDMTRWSDAAARAKNRNWTLADALP